MRTPTELAWAAGLYEGEGTVGFHTEGRNGWVGSLRARVSMTDADVVAKFRDAVGFGHLTDRQPSQPNRKHVYTWGAGKFEHVQALACFFWPWLGERRRAQLRRALTAFHDAPRQHVGRYHSEEARRAALMRSQRISWHKRRRRPGEGQAKLGDSDGWSP